MHFAIIGGGNTGRAAAAYLSARGASCALRTRDGALAALLRRDGLTAGGAVNGVYPVAATTSMAEAVSGADVIIITTVANAHRAVAQELKPHLEPGQRILVFNSNWGAFELKQVLGEDIRKKRLVVAETAAQLFVASTPAPGQVLMSVKASVSAAATDSAQTGPLLAQLSPWFPQFTPAASILQTTLSSTNPVIHVPIVLFNAARVENGQRFLFYGDGASRGAVALVERVDRERLAVAQALGCEIDDILTGINGFWPEKHDNLFDALTQNESYLRAVGPESLDHRYLTEDVPYGIDPISQLGRLTGVETPCIDTILALLRCALPPELVGPRLFLSREELAL